MKPLRYILLVFCMTTLLVASYGQEPKVLGKIEPTKILIGEESTLEIRVSHPVGAHVELVLPKDTLVPGVEIKSQILSDSTIVTDKLREYIYKVTLTSFDSASYQLNHIGAMVDGRMVLADEAPILMVTTVPVDAAHPEKFADIKKQWAPQFVWKDYIGVGIALIAFVLILALSIYLWLKYGRKRRALTTEEPVVEPLIDPYKEALEEMTRLKESDLLETSQVKAYYSRMTEVLRRFIHRVYNLETTEKTSTEILSDFRRLGEKERGLSKGLEKILETADYAKFAKFQPDADENKALWEASMDFVEEVRQGRSVEESTLENSNGKEVKA